MHQKQCQRLVLSYLEVVMTIQQRREVSLMYYNFDGSIDDSDRRLYLAKDRTKAAKPGKYQQRAKADRPKDKLADAKTERCHKMKISSIEIAKSINASARWSRAAQASSRSARESQPFRRRAERG